MVAKFLRDPEKSRVFCDVSQNHIRKWDMSRLELVENSPALTACGELRFAGGTRLAYIREARGISRVFDARHSRRGVANWTNRA
jgi:hypothetical protein